MKIVRTEAPLFWCCDECHLNKQLPPTKISVKDNLPETSRQRNSSLVHHDTRVSAGVNGKYFASGFSFKEKQFQTVRTKYISCEEAVKLSTMSKKAKGTSLQASNKATFSGNIFLFRRNRRDNVGPSVKSRKSSKIVARGREKKIAEGMSHGASNVVSFSANNSFLSRRNRKDNAGSSTETLRSSKRMQRERVMKMGERRSCKATAKVTFSRNNVSMSLRNKRNDSGPSTEATRSFRRSEGEREMETSRFERANVGQPMEVHKSSKRVATSYTGTEEGMASKVVPPPKNGGANVGDSIGVHKSCDRGATSNTETEMVMASTVVLPPRNGRADVGASMEVCKSSERGETSNRETKMGMASTVVLPPINGGTDVGDSMDVPASCERGETSNRDTDAGMVTTEALPPRNGGADVGDFTEVYNSCERGETINRVTMETGMAKEVVAPPTSAQTDVGPMEVPEPVREAGTSSSGTEMDAGITNQTTVEVGNSDGENPNQSTNVLSECIPAAYAYWKTHIKVYQALRRLPDELFFTLVPHQEVWTRILPEQCPDKDDIGMYFFPRFQRSSSSEKYRSLLDFLWTNMLVLKTQVVGVELFVLPSRHLQPNSQTYQGRYFLWGACGRDPLQIIESVQPTPQVAPEGFIEEQEPVDMDIDTEDEGSFSQSR